MMIPPKVKRRKGSRGIIRQGKGYSKAELAEIGLPLNIACRLGITTDSRRKTNHPENLTSLREWLASTGKSIPELIKAATPMRRLKRKSPTRRIFRGLTSSGRRTRGLLRTRGQKGTRHWRYTK